MASILDQDGNMPFAKQNELLTGGLSFKINLNGSEPAVRDDLREQLGRGTSLKEGQTNEGPRDVNTIQPPLEVVTRDLSYSFGTLVTDSQADGGSDDFGSNGPNNSLDNHFNDFDTGSLGSLGDTTCGICFGRGYVGGFSVLQGWRQVFCTQWKDKTVDEGFIEVNKLPHMFSGRQVTFRSVLPKGFKRLDRLQVWNNTSVVTGATVKIDGQTVDYPLLFTKFDGLMHDIQVSFDQETDWTHLEFQVDMGNQARIEFPRLTNGFDANKLDGLEGVQLNMSPVVPYVTIRDVIVESTFGKGFVLTSTEFWNSKDRRVLGWNCQARIVQPNEILNLLPRRMPVQQQKPTRLVRDNVDGHRRT
jgi:hypothetical protein